ncbi:hypothetical protein ACFL6I_10595 [candidate division KSB1 bacterium]
MVVLKRMETVDKDILKVLELLAYKLKEHEMGSRNTELYKDEAPEEDEPLQFLIYEDDLKSIGMDKHSFCSNINHLEKEGFIIIEFVRDPNKFDYDDVDDSDILNGELRLSLFGIVVPSFIYNVLENYKNGKGLRKSTNQIEFDEEKSVLSVGGFEIQIARQNKLTNEHKILKYIFEHEDNIRDEFFYADIAEEEFGESLEEYKKSKDGWRRYHSACKSINEKVRNATDGKIDQFLIFNSTSFGKVRINSKY